jgi:Rrf2 family protein
MLSQKAKYALQALSYLAEHFHEEERVLIGTISRERNIPMKFLQTILCQLKNHDILNSSRGRKGGYRLSIDPKKLPVARIIRLVDGPVALLSCVSINFYKRCDNCTQQTCGINRIMSEAREAILKILEKRSLNDIVDLQQLAVS